MGGFPHYTVISLGTTETLVIETAVLMFSKTSIPYPAAASVLAASGLTQMAIKYLNLARNFEAELISGWCYEDKVETSNFFRNLGLQFRSPHKLDR